MCSLQNRTGKSVFSLMTSFTECYQDILYHSCLCGFCNRKLELSPYVQPTKSHRQPFARAQDKECLCYSKPARISVLFLSHDVDVHGGGVAQEAVDGEHIEILAPALACRAAENHLRDMFFADKFGRGGRDILAL